MDISIRRQKIRTQLRRQQIQKQFQSRRQLLTHVGDYYYHTFKDNLQKMEISMNQANPLSCRSGFNKLIELIKYKSQASSYVFMHSQNMSELIDLIAEYKIISQSEQQISRLIKQNDQNINSLLEFLTIINYNALDYKSFERVFKSFYKILSYKQIQSQNLAKALIVVNRMMDPPNQIVFACLKGYNFSVKLSQIIKLTKVNQINHRFKNILLEAISLLLKNEHAFQQNPDNYYKQNKFFLQYCLKDLKKTFQSFNPCFQLQQIEETLQLDLIAIRYVLEFDTKLSELIEQKDLTCFIELMKSNIRKIQVSVVQIINILLCEDSSFCDSLVGKFQFLQLIDKKLRKQLYFTDHDTKNLVQKCGFILCNITMVRDNKLKMKIYKQPIWKFVLNNIKKFNTLVEVFTFYFQLVPTNELLKRAQQYLDAIAELDQKYLQKIYKKNISFTIQRLHFRVKEQLTKSGLHKFLQKIQQQKHLQFYFNDEMQDKIDEDIQDLLL